MEREGLACVFGVKKFHAYLCGHSFGLITDHQPLLTLLSEHKPTSTQSSARIKRWSLLFSSYEYKITFRRTQAHGNADTLSRLPISTHDNESSTPPKMVLLLEHNMEDSPVTQHHIHKWTFRDAQLSKVLRYVQSGWPNHYNPELKSYFSKRPELSVHKNCILWRS